MSNAVEKSALNIHLDPLPASPAQLPGLERSVLALCGTDRLGLVFGISSYLRDHEANLELSAGRRLHELHGAHYVFSAPSDSMKEIKEDGILESCLHNAQDFDRQPAAPPYEYELTLIAPDRPGILATVAETLLKRKVSIAANDTVTFEMPAPSELGGSEEFLKISTLNLLLEIQRADHQQTLEDLTDGLEYLEHRYHWYIQLEKHLKRKKTQRESWLSQAFSQQERFLSN